MRSFLWLKNERQTMKGNHNLQRRRRKEVEEVGRCRVREDSGEEWWKDPISNSSPSFTMPSNAYIHIDIITFRLNELHLWIDNISELYHSGSNRWTLIPLYKIGGTPLTNIMLGFCPVSHNEFLRNLSNELNLYKEYPNISVSNLIKPKSAIKWRNKTRKTMQSC